ncbi:MAG: sigma-70 family RNA polymerase sigma factor [Chloroflexi bacterium]|nr:sigma-70 family RNA polymerase sigma factor [Chloroflexota bacterium]
MEIRSGTEQDLPPEFCHYRDEGCEFARACLDCPLPRCVYDHPGGGYLWRKGQRNAEMVRLFMVEAMSVKEIARRFSISERTVQRVLRKALATGGTDQR